MSEAMGRNPRVMASFPPKTYKLLEVWANRDGMSLSALVAYICKRVTDEEEQAGRLSVPTDED